MKHILTDRKNKNLDALSAPLPEDIARMIAHGDLNTAARAIDRRLEKKLPEMMKERLRIEKEILALLPLSYPYTKEEAFHLLQENFQDFTEEEFEDFLLESAFEWIYLNGEMRVKNNFIANLVKTREEMADRVVNRGLIEGKWENFRMLDEAVAWMKAKDSVSCRFRIRSTISIHPDKEQPGVWLQVQIPLPLEYSQVTDFALISSSPEGACVAPAQCMQRTICFEGVFPQGQKFSVEYEFETTMRYWDWKKAMAGEPCGSVGSFEACSNYGFDVPGMQMLPTKEDLEEQIPQIAFTPYLRAMTAEAVGAETDPLKKAKAIYDFITTRVMYSFVRGYFQIPQHVSYIASGMKGDCGLQALLFITMCRIAGIPARWQSGLFNNPLAIGNHDWALFYLEEYGWLYADCSFGGAAYRAGDLERWDFYFGNLEPYRLPAACAYQADFVFPKKYLRSDPYDNQNGEAEYENCGLMEGVDFDSDYEMLSLEIKRG